MLLLTETNTFTELRPGETSQLNWDQTHSQNLYLAPCFGNQDVGPTVMFSVVLIA